MSKALGYFLNNNPYCVLGISCNADEVEIIKAKEKIAKLAKLGAEKTYKTQFYSSNLPEIDRSEGVVQGVLTTIRQPQHKLFWFETPELLNSTIFSNEYETFLTNDNQVISYDFFLVNYMQLIMKDTEIQFDHAWQKLCSLVTHYVQNKELLSYVLHTRDIEKPNDLFSESILNPLIDLMEEHGIDASIRLLKITSSFKNTAFQEFNEKGIDILSSKIKTQINKIKQDSELEKNQLSKAHFVENSIKKLCVDNVKVFNELVDVTSSSKDRISSVIFSEVDPLLNVYMKNDVFRDALECIGFFKNYMPSYKLSEFKEMENTLEKIESGYRIVKQQVESGRLHYQDKLLFENEDVLVRYLFLKAMGGDASSAYSIGTTMSTETQKRTQSVNIRYDENRGMHWIKKAADNGHSDAAFAIGYHYFASETDRNLLLSDYYIQMAKKQGNELAIILANNSNYNLLIGRARMKEENQDNKVGYILLIAFFVFFFYLIIIAS